MVEKDFKEILEESARLIKKANIDDMYLASIGFDTSRKNGCCPVHVGNNKTGFSYTEKKGYRQYSCWTVGCIGTGVDIIHLCKVKENLTTEYEAIKFLANMFNIELPKIKSRYKSKREKARDYMNKKLK